jgi:hypothetical protein
VALVELQALVVLAELALEAVEAVAAVVISLLVKVKVTYPVAVVAAVVVLREVQVVLLEAVLILVLPEQLVLVTTEAQAALDTCMEEVLVVREETLDSQDLLVKRKPLLVVAEAALEHLAPLVLLVQLDQQVREEML